MAPLRYAAKFDPFLSLDCAPTPSTLAQSKERKGSNFAIWQPCSYSGGGEDSDSGAEMEYCDPCYCYGKCCLDIVASIFCVSLL